MLSRSDGMGTALFLTLVAILVVSVLGIVAVCSILDCPRYEPGLRRSLDRKADPADERDNLLPT
jgi:hypothetical protein